jgi:hypothetical protein
MIGAMAKESLSEFDAIDDKTIIAGELDTYNGKLGILGLH